MGCPVDEGAGEGDGASSDAGVALAA